MDFEVIETAVYERLQPLTAAGTDYELRYMPENETAYDQDFDETKRGRMSVLCVGSKADEQSRATDRVIQDDYITIEIECEARVKRGENGVYTLIKLVKKRLLGYKSPYFTKLLLDSVDFVSWEQNRFIYSVKFKGRTSEVQDLDPDNLPTLQVITLDENIAAPGDETVIPNQDFPQPGPDIQLTVGDTLAWDGERWVRIPVGGPGTVFVSNGPGELPTWELLT